MGDAVLIAPPGDRVALVPGGDGLALNDCPECCEQGPCSRYVIFRFNCPGPPNEPEYGPCLVGPMPNLYVCSDALCDIADSPCSPEGPQSIHPCGGQPRVIVVGGLCYRSDDPGPDGRLESFPITNLPPGTVVLGTGDFQCAPLSQGCGDARCLDDRSRLFVRATPCPGQPAEPRGVYICAASIQACGTFHVDHNGTDFCYINQGPTTPLHQIPAGALVIPTDPGNPQSPTCCQCLTGCQFVDIVPEPPCNPLASGGDRCCYETTWAVQLVAYSGGSIFNRSRDFPDFYERYEDSLDISPVGSIAIAPIATIRRRAYIRFPGQAEQPNGESTFQLTVPNQPGFPNGGNSWPQAMANGGIARSCSPMCVAGGAGSICTVSHAVGRTCFTLAGSATWESRAPDNFLNTDQNVSFLVQITPTGRCSGGCSGNLVVGGNGTGAPGTGCGNCDQQGAF